MKVLTSSSGHFVITPDGKLWTKNASEAYPFWTRYLECFEEVRLCVRAESRESPSPGLQRADGEGVKAIPVTDFTGVLGYAKNAFEIRKSVRSVAVESDAILLRLPCVIGNIVCRFLPRGKPFGIEVICDPQTIFSPGVIDHPLRRAFRFWFPYLLRKQCLDACAVCYVTREFLQRKYPAHPDALSLHCSDADLVPGDFVSCPRSVGLAKKLVMVGNLARLYKGPDILLRALQICVESDLDLRLTIVGEGRFRRSLEEKAAHLGLAHRVRFAGAIASRDGIRKELDKADLFVLPSLTEGLPRALIEAMARALPCISTTVGGIPELLAGEDLVSPGNIQELAARISEVSCCPDRLRNMSQRNLARAQLYSKSELHARRTRFFKAVRKQTEAWRLATGKSKRTAWSTASQKRKCLLR